LLESSDSPFARVVKLSFCGTILDAALDLMRACERKRPRNPKQGILNVHVDAKRNEGARGKNGDTDLN
jgi:hypothetical protein